MPTIYIDNKPYTVSDGQNLLRACLSLGFNLPYFCWHPALHAVGACRQCAVKQFRDEKDTRGKIIMSCMTPVSEGIRISIDDPEAKAFRKGIIELLMTNHPHDCPVCDEGGECHLQDMTVMTGHAYRRYRFSKRTHVNQCLGPFVAHEMNRCIQCYRCLRFYRDYAGGRDLNVFASHDHVYFGRAGDGVLGNEFSGNLVEVCPTGVFTDKSLKRHYTRSWDLRTAPSICVHCSLGCNTFPGERYGELRRMRNRYNGAVNGYFLCDRGRYGYEFVNSGRRLREPFKIEGDGPKRERKILGKGEALDTLSRLLFFGARVVGIGSPRASLESNFALRELVGPEHFCTGMSRNEMGAAAAVISAVKSSPARTPSLRETASCDAVLVLGEDVTNTAPLLALSLRQAVRQKPLKAAERLHIPPWDDTALREAAQNEKGPLFVAAPEMTKLEEEASLAYHAAPDDIARLGFAVASEISGNEPEVKDLPDELRIIARAIAEGLKAAQKPLVVSGTGCRSEAVVHAAAAVTRALCEEGLDAALFYTLSECNSLGVAMMGGNSLEDAFSAALEDNADTAVILENDLYSRARDVVVENFFDACSHVVVIDHLLTPTMEKADIGLPAATFAEASGTLVNNEGRAQRFYQVFPPSGEIQASWRWLRDIMVACRREEPAEWKGLDEMSAAVAAALPAFAGITAIAPPANFRITGRKIPREAHRCSGRTAVSAHLSLREPRPAADPDSPLSFSMEGHEGKPPSALVARFWTPGWNSVQALTRFQEEINGPLRGGDPGVRLMEFPPKTQSEQACDVPGPFIPRKDEWLFLPLYHIFGSEELSLLSPGVAELSPGPYLGLSPGDAVGLRLSEGDMVRVRVEGEEYRLPVRHAAGLAHGTAGFPAGLPGLNPLELPLWGMIEREAPAP